MVRWTEMLVSEDMPPPCVATVRNSRTGGRVEHLEPGMARLGASYGVAQPGPRPGVSSGRVRARSRSSLGRPRRALKSSTISGRR